MANPFYVEPVNPLQALMLGQQGFDRARKSSRESEQDVARRAAEAALSSGGDTRSAIAKLIGVGDTAGAKALSDMELARSNADWQKTYQGRMLTIAEQNANRREIPSGFQSAPGGLDPIPGGPHSPEYLRTVGNRQNAPPGYKWVDPNDTSAGLEPVKGGPAEKVPAEVAARIGLAKSFLGQLEKYKDRAGVEQPGIRERIKAGQATGVVGGPMANLNIGKPGELRRLISSGAEALLRNLTGAGMNMDEAKKYVQRYQPEWNDSSQTLLSKVDQLERELISVIETVSKGRGGVSTSGQQSGQSMRQPQPAELQKAKQAIQSGAPREAVIQRLRDNGIDISGM